MKSHSRARRFSACVGGMLIVNGIYDMVCAVCVLTGTCGPLSVIHLDTLSDTPWTTNTLAIRLAPSWMFMNACVRIAAGLSTSDTLDALAVISYFVEGVLFLSPPHAEATVTIDSILVNTLCLLCELCVALRQHPSSDSFIKPF